MKRKQDDDQAERNGHRVSRAFSGFTLTWLLAASLQPVYATDLSDLYDRVSDSVVAIFSTQHSRAVTRAGAVSSEQVQAGSGVIVNDSGLVLTASHVADLADSLEVHLKNGEIHAARVISTFPFADIGLIRIVDPPPHLQVATMGNSDQLRMGEEVMVIGAPFGFSQTVTIGHLSGRPKDTGSFNVANTEFLQTDAAINPGNSGGPMFNNAGEVMGIVSHIRTDANGMAFVASANMIRSLFMEFGEVWGGVEVLPMDATLASALLVPYIDSVLVQNVADGSLAHALGVRAGTIDAVIAGRSLKLGGDIILSIGGHPLHFTRDSMGQVYHYLGHRAHGEPVEMVVYRDGREVTLVANKP